MRLPIVVSSLRPKLEHSLLCAQGNECFTLCSMTGKQLNILLTLRIHHRKGNKAKLSTLLSHSLARSVSPLWYCWV